MRWVFYEVPSPSIIMVPVRKIVFYIFALEIPSVNNLAFAQRSNPKIRGVLGVWDNSTSITNRGLQS